MSIDERPAPPPPSAAPTAPSGDRLRVITAGVSNIEAPLGTSGFDVVAVPATEDALLVAVSTDEPDAIVVEADLCETLERVRDLAPDAVMIVVGDHTPAGALGRIERGVSGTVMARLLHALVAEGVGGAVAWGLVPAFAPPAGGLRAAQHVSGSLLSANAELFRAHVTKAIHDHTGLVAAASTAVVTASVSLLFTLSAPRTQIRPDRVADPSPVVERAGQYPVATVPSATELPPHRATDARPGDRHAQRGDASTDPRRHHRSPSEHGGRPEDATQRATRDASRPPGVANGWDHRPPKHEDNGHRNGWTSNAVPEDLPPGDEIRRQMSRNAPTNGAKGPGSRGFAIDASSAI
jgi:hypothetical protein